MPRPQWSLATPPPNGAMPRPQSPVPRYRQMAQREYAKHLSPDISPVCGIMAERSCPRFVLATEGVVGATPEGARANLGQEIQPEAAKRAVVQTATLDTGRFFMVINKLHAKKSVLVKYPG